MTDQTVAQFPPSDMKNLQRFIALERRLVGSNPLFTSDIDADIMKRLTGRSAYFKDNIEHVLFIAARNGRTSRAAAR